MASAKRHPILKTCLGTLMLREEKVEKGEATTSGDGDAAVEVAEVANELNAMDVGDLAPQATASASTSGGGNTPQSLPAPPKGGMSILRNRGSSVSSSKSDNSTKVSYGAHSGTNGYDLSTFAPDS